MAHICQEIGFHLCCVFGDFFRLAYCFCRFMLDRHSPNGSPLGLHIGIATGPVGAGVIGRTKFAYDLWGNTVNVAARLASSAEFGQVAVDEVTYKRLRGRYRFEGPMFTTAKGKGQITSYFLAGRLSGPERVQA